MSNPMVKAVSSDGLLLRQGAKGGVGGGGGGDAGHGGDGLPFLLLLLLLASRCYQRVLNCSIGRPLGRNRDGFCAVSSGDPRQGTRPCSDSASRQWRHTQTLVGFVFAAVPSETWWDHDESGLCSFRGRGRRLLLWLLLAI